MDIFYSLILGKIVVCMKINLIVNRSSENGCWV